MTSNVWSITHQYGGMSKHTWATDPKRLGFMLARYKFVAKMLAGKQNVLEIGCADGMGTHVVAQAVGHVFAIDDDRLAIKEAKANQRAPNVTFLHGDFFSLMQTDDPIRQDATYTLDVLEHIPLDREDDFLAKMARKSDVCIIGSPSLESQHLASPLSVAGHVNCKTGPDFVSTLQRHFSQVFPFSMNDDAVYPGAEPMARYRLGVCVR